MSRVLIAVLTLTTLLGCSGPTIDTSTDEAMEASIGQVRAALDPPTAARFDSALMIIALGDLDFSAVFAGEAGIASMTGAVKSKLEGKSAEEVIAAADSILAEQAAERRRQAIQEIGELEERQREVQAGMEAMQAFEVTRSRFYLAPQRFGRPEPVIELTVKNGLDVAVSRAYFIGTIQSEGRSVPWHRDSFNYQIPGGLEPGETADWTLSPNMFSDWGRVDAPSDAVFTVEVERLDGPDGEALYGEATWSDRDQQRLDELRQEYGG